MEINYYAIALCSILAMALGAVWYGPLFGKKWDEVVGIDSSDSEARKKMQSAAKPLYVAQFLLTLFQVTVFAYLMHLIDPAIDISLTLIIWTSSALTIWAAFVIPTIASNAMWNNDSRRIAWTRFFIQSGYQLVSFLMSGIILGLWR